MKPAMNMEAKSMFDAKLVERILTSCKPNSLWEGRKSMESFLPELPESISFPHLEHQVANYWKQIDAFSTHLNARKRNQQLRNEVYAMSEESLQDLRNSITEKLQSGTEERAIGIIDTVRGKISSLRSSNSYIFYEGPPFATGLPHYGHLLAATIKDVVCRYYSNIDVSAASRAEMKCELEESLQYLKDAGPKWNSFISSIREVLQNLDDIPQGLYIERLAGWDCHGLPIEFEIEKKLKIKTKAEVEKFGIDKYNEHCRAIVMRFRDEWEKVIGRVGRWVDFDPAKEYKTMNKDYMESVWYIFQKLFRKNLIYSGFKVMPFSIGCGTPLSNFEANLDYRDVNDPSILVGFKISTKTSHILSNAQLVAWTTTPWTLPANYALVVNPELEYVIVEQTKNSVVRTFVVADCRYDFFLSMMKQKGEDTAWDVKGKVLGQEIVGVHYEPLFSTLRSVMDTIFESEAAVGTAQKGFVVLGDGYVSSTAGTGIVHCAPCFGEDDYRVCTENGLISMENESSRVTMSLLPYLCPINENGFFTTFIGEESLVQAHIKEKETESKIITYLKENNRLLAKGTIVHSYPFCWRSEVPLIYKAVSSWFVKIDVLRERMVQLVTENSHWVPGHVCEKRFVNWIKGVNSEDEDEQKSSKGKDWAISRSRFWGTPLPIWKSADEKSVVVIGSIHELKTKGFVRGEDGALISLGNIPINDLHRHHIDHFLVLDPRGEDFPPLQRVPEVFDCWFESGCMPYAQRHFPFSYKDEEGAAEKMFLSSHFPANFIAEGLDQTRGWFYTLLVLGTACFDAIPFRNVIVNGLVLANDGRKMSKKLKNYPDPTEVVEEHGADALRMYFMNSNVVRGEPLRFNVEGVREIVKDILIPLMSALKFLSQNINRYVRDNIQTFESVPGDKQEKSDINVRKAFLPAFSATNGFEISENIMDQWIVSETQTLLGQIHENMAKYHLFAIPGKLFSFLPLLTNFYVRMNRGRMKGQVGAQDQLCSLRALLYVLYNFVLLLSSFAPFMAEFAYAILRPLLPEYLQEKSVHLCILPYPSAGLKNSALESTFCNMRQVIEGVRTLRDQQKIPLKSPLQSVIVAHPSPDVCQDMQNSVIMRYMAEEMNVLTIESANVYDICSIVLQPNLRVLGKKMKDKIKQVVAELRDLKQREIIEWVQKTDSEEGGSCVLMLKKSGVELTRNDINVLYTLDNSLADESFSRLYGSKKEDFRSIQVGPFILFLNVNYKNNEALQRKTICRLFVSQAQQLRKKHNFVPSDKISVQFYINADEKHFSAKNLEGNVAACTINGIQTRSDNSALNKICSRIQEGLLEEREEIEKRLNANINFSASGNEKMRETVPFYEESITLTLVFY